MKLHDKFMNLNCLFNDVYLFIDLYEFYRKIRLNQLENNSGEFSLLRSYWNNGMVACRSIYNQLNKICWNFLIKNLIKIKKNIFHWFFIIFTSKSLFILSILGWYDAFNISRRRRPYRSGHRIATTRGGS